MTTSINITEEIVEGKWRITAFIMQGSDIPVDIFLYENTGSGLGEYVTVCSIQDYKKTQSFTGTNIPTFGNKFVRFTSAVKVVPLSSDPKLVSAKFQQDIREFRTQFLSGYSTTNVVTLS